MAEPEDKAALAEAIRCGQLDLDDLVDAARDLSPYDLFALCEDLHLDRPVYADLHGMGSPGDARPHGWLTLCARQAQKPVTAWGPWSDDPLGCDGPAGFKLFGAYQDYLPSERLEPTWPWAWLRGALAAARAAASLRADLAARRWSNETPKQLEPLLHKAYAWLELSEMEFPLASAYGLARSFLTDSEDDGPLASQGLFVLGVIDGRGFAYRLRIDLLDEGCGQLYPLAEQSAARQDDAFTQGLAAVEQYLRSVQLWPVADDLRWSFTPVDDDHVIERLEGASASAAFALAIGRLLVGQDWAVPAALQGLDELDLARVAVSAAFTQTGRLCPVTGLWKKVAGAAAELANSGALDLLVVAHEQPDVPETTALPVRQAADLAAALKIIQRTTGPWGAALHWAGSLEALKLKGVGRRARTWEQHYQPLPLFQLINPEDLPPEKETSQAAQERDAASAADPEARVRSRYRTLPIAAWHEAARRARTRRERRYGSQVAVQRLFTDLRGVLAETTSKVAQKQPAGAPARFIVVGEPGAGKSTLAAYLVREVLSGRLGRADGTPWLPVLVPLRAWESRHRDLSVPALLEQLVRTNAGDGEAEIDKPAAPAATWAHWLRRGRVLLLFDGLDEVGPDFAAPLRTVLGNADW
jgi:hypothetical protein